MTTASNPSYPLQGTNLPTSFLYLGRFQADSTPAISSGKGFTVERVATGRWTVTLNKPVKVIASFGTLAQATGSDTKLRKPVWDAANEGAYKVEFATEDEDGLLEDPPAGSEIEFMIGVMTVTSLPD
jgi:hypothetical protein